MLLCIIIVWYVFQAVLGVFHAVLEEIEKQQNGGQKPGGSGGCTVS